MSRCWPRQSKWEGKLDFSLVERLSPYLAWPIAALLMFVIAAPLIYLKLGDISKAILAVKELPANLSRTLQEFQVLADAVSRETKALTDQVDLLATRMNSMHTELAKTIEQIKVTQSELQSAQTERDEETINDDARAIRSIVGIDANGIANEEMNIATMHEHLIGKWTRFETQLRQRVEAAGRVFDPRRPGQAAYVLTDGRRSNRITRAQADLIKKLGSQYRKFERLSEAGDEWLSPEVYSAFIAGVEQSSQALRGDDPAV